MTNDDLLYRYFSNSLSKTETEQFKKLLETDAEFKAQFEFENNLKRVIKHKENSELKAKLRDFETEIVTRDNKQKSKSFNWRIAASIIILLGVSWFGYQSFFGVNYEDLYNANYQEYPNTEYAITRSDTIDSPERRAFVAYEAQDFENAITLFENLPVAVKKPYHIFYKAQAYLKIGDIEKSKAIFKSIITEGKPFKAESYWYLAMIALKEEDKNEALKYLKILKADYNYNKVKTEALLKRLN
ncbi:hypothetical protein [Lacinutrix sp. MedPE-SW]|uniref:tetratricopeptide repeat protein n=1 Tax=Lacinutrix sp. MedPE-SW TaxID=1860087 RepID=UPI00091EEE8B|nr:hypothetical protein [Lacinutrix sp. MedPE-SW]OIQ21276.1 MAG: hypothetical protein BM549_09895 [Lacinutrix sp. MedPE-SW]